MRSFVAKSFQRIMPRVMIGVLFVLEVAWILFLVYAFVRFALPADGRTSYLGPGRPRGKSGGPLTTSPPAEKTTASRDQAGKASTGDGAGDRDVGERQDLGEKLVADDVVRHVRRMDNNVIEVLVRVRADGPS